MKKLRINLAVFLAILSILLLTFSGVGAAAPDGPIVTLSASQSEYSSDQEVVLQVTISNPTRHSVRVLKWFTPANGLEEPVFFVTVDGKAVEYIGAIYKRPAATGKDYMVLKAGQNVSYQVVLDEYYDLSVGGEYQISYQAASYNLFSEKASKSPYPDVLISPTISLKIDGRAPKKPTQPPPPTPGGTTFTACTTTQQAILLNAREQAKTYASESENYLKTHSTGTPRYVEWFGVYTLLRYSTVTSHFTNISDAWDNAGVTFDCSCKQNYYAYVYPTKPYTIYLCKVFWSAPLAGTDSQGGTLIHEMSHFDVVAGTDDYVYGQTGARDLAISNPDNAINNADNHEYFAENNPYLP